MLRLNQGTAIFVANFAMVLIGQGAIAQIIPDNTLGIEASSVTPNIQLNNRTIDLIQGGAERGSNLFHSFQEFNIGAGQQVYFDNPAATQAIFSRVTGNDISNILGTLGVNGNADLFLLNPNGILFGENAILDIPGSFLATTADAFTFENNLSFSAVSPQAAPLMTVNLTPGLQFGANSPQTISNLGQLQTGKDLTLAAGNLDIQGQLEAGQDLTLTAQNTATFRDTETNPLIVLAGQDLLVEGKQLIDIFALSHLESGLYSGSDLTLTSPNEVIGDTYYYSGGNFTIENKSNNLGGLISEKDPVIRSLGDVSFNNYQGASLHIIAGGYVSIPGVILLTGADGTNGLQETITLSDNTQIEIDGKTTPTLDVRAGVSSDNIGLPTGLTGNGTFSSGIVFSGNPTSADIVLGTIINNPVPLTQQADFFVGVDGKIFLSNQYKPNRNLDTQFGGITLSNVQSRNNLEGGVFIDSRSDITLTGEVITSSAVDRSKLFVSPLTNPYSGNGGEVKFLAARDITLESQSYIFNEGSLSDKITLNSGGNIDITDSSIGNASTGSGGKGGTISLSGQNIRIDNSSLSTQSSFRVNSGDLQIKAKTLELLNGTALKTIASGQGDGGIIVINVTDSVLLEGQGFAGESNSILRPVAILSLIEPSIYDLNPEGNAGSINISTGNLQIFDSGQINASSSGKGNGGNIVVKATEFILIDGKTVGNFTSGVLSRVESAAEGNAGSITVNTGRLDILNGAKIDATTFGTGSAGKVIINANESIVLEGKNARGISGGISSQIALGATGDSGEISISTENLEVLNGGQITASTSGDGNAGNILINSDRLTLRNGGEILSFSQSVGDGGRIEINATESVTLEKNGVTPVISVETSNAGKAGNIEVNTPQFTLSETARITATATKTATNLEGGGSITIGADRMNLAGVVGIFAETQGNAPAGRLLLKPYQNNPNLDVDLVAGSKISAATSGSGNGGDLIVTAPNNIDISGAGILSVETTSSGNAGTIAVTSKNLALRDGVTLSASTAGSGNGGFIEFTIARDINVVDSSVQAITKPGSTGKGGSIDIDSINANLVNSRVAVDSQGAGIGGDIFVTSDFLDLTNSAIATETFSSDGGNVSLNIGNRLSLNKGSNVTATAGLARRSGDGGNITVFVPSIVASVDEDNNIFADAFSGAGGRIFVSVNELINIGFQPENIPVRNDITASSGVQSSRLIFTPELTSFLQAISFSRSGIPQALLSLLDAFSGSVVIESEVEEDNESPSPLVDPSGLIDRRCVGSSTAGLSQFNIVGRGGRPSQPTDIFDVSESLEDTGLSPEELLGGDGLDISTTSTTSSSSSSSSKSDTVTTTATAIQRSRNGDIQLTAADSSPQTSAAIAPSPSSHNCSL